MTRSWDGFSAAWLQTIMMDGACNVLEMLKEWILDYGYAALYGLLAVGIIGLPVPDEILMTFVGYLTSIGWFSYPAALAVAFAGALTGMLISYYIGHKVGKPFLRKYGKWVKLTPRRLDKAEGWFHRFGLWTVTFGYFVPGVRHLTCYLAGISGVGFWRYLIYACTGALLWSATFISLGHFIGQNIDSVMPQIHRYMGYGLLGIAVLAAGTAYFMVKSRKRVAGSR
ncbi:DedA family protein [Gorillibacterium sp. sgz5001074]|uniref:DedA family protein n=1 Tax=Gorillibacterium sp. sgz5001074 TaxID=3446695 RepID=UPI003F67BB42